MTKILILLACLIGLVAAGVMDTRTLRGGTFNNARTGLVNNGPVLQNEGEVYPLTGINLVRQKILLSLLDHVHQPLEDKYLNNIPNQFNANDGNYINGIDDDMVYVIQLQQNGGLLGKRDIFDVARNDDKRQMIGLKRLLSRAIDFDIFVQNAVTARNTMNGVLFVNALLLAVRERNDTRNLIVPAIHDILPELYIDRNTLRTLANIDINLLTTSTGYNTKRPSLFNMIGLSDRSGQWGPNLFSMFGLSGRNDLWGQLEDYMAVQRNKLASSVGKVVINEVNSDIKDVTMQLLTDDVGLKGFLHNLFIDIALKENELEKGQALGSDYVSGANYEFGNREGKRFGGFDNEKYVGYGRKQTKNDLIQNVPYSAIGDERLLHVNGKKLRSLKDGTRSDFSMRDRFYDTVNINDGRKVMANVDTYNDEKILNKKCLKCIDRRTVKDCNACLTTTDDYVLDQLNYECRICIRDMNDDACDRCQAKIEMGIGLGRNDAFENGGYNENPYLRNRFVDESRTPYTSSHYYDARYINDGQNIMTNMGVGLGQNDAYEDRNQFNQNPYLKNRFVDESRTPYTNSRFYDARYINDGRKIMTNIGMDLGQNDAYEDRSYSDDVFWRKRMDNARQTPYNYNGILNIGANRLNAVCVQCAVAYCSKCPWTTDDVAIAQLGTTCKRCILNNGYTCNKCNQNVNFNNQNMDAVNDWDVNGYNGQVYNDLNSRDRFMNVLFRPRIYDGRKILDTTVADDTRGGQFVANNYLDASHSTKSTRSEILLHNLKQVLARITLERISLGLDSTNKIGQNYNNVQYAGLGNSGYGNTIVSGRNDIGIQRLIDFINTKIAHKLNVGTSGRVTDVDVDRVIARALIEREGNVNILDILTDVIVGNMNGGENMQIVRDIGLALNDEKVIGMLREIVKNVEKVRTQVLGTYTRDDLEFDDVKINNVIVDRLATATTYKDIDLRNLLDTKNKVVVVRQKQLTHNEFNIQVDVDSKINQRVVVRTFIGPKRIDDLGRDLTLNERRTDFIQLDTNVYNLNAGRNIINLGSRDLLWTKRNTMTLLEIYKRVMTADKGVDINVGNDFGTGQDCRFPHRLILPRGRDNGLDLELLVVITQFEGDVVQAMRDDLNTKCGMGISVKGVDMKSLGYPLDRQIENTFDIRSLNNVAGVDVKIYHDDRKGKNLW